MFSLNFPAGIRVLEAVRWRHGPPAWRSLLLTPSRKMRSVLNCLLPLYSMSSLLESLKVSMSFNEPRNYTTGREIIAKKNFENSQALRKGLQRFGLHRCDCNFLLTQRYNNFSEIHRGCRVGGVEISVLLAQGLPAINELCGPHVNLNRP